MKIQPFCLSSGYTNCYVASKGNDAYLIDAPDCISAALEYVRDEALNLKGVLLTHGHYDHVLGLCEVSKAYPSIPIHISKEDICFLEDGGKKNRDILSYFPSATREYNLLKSLPEDYIPYSDSIWEFTILKTPGHTMGSICLLSEKDEVLFSGDTLFEGSIGRSELGGSYSLLMESLGIMKTLNNRIVVLPGHGGFTTISKELESNPYLR